MVRAYRAAEVGQSLARLAANRPRGAVDLDLHFALLELQEELETTAAPPQLSEPEARARIGAGQPLTDGDTAVSPADIRRATERIRELVERRRPELAGELDAADPTLVRLALQGLLRPFAATLAPLVDERGWLKPACPVCGGPPDFAVIAGPARERRLVCSRCDAEWAFARIGCPFCGATDPEQLGYYPAGEGPYRLYVCDECGGYLKAAELKGGEVHCPPAERILAAPLDLAGAHLGYSPRDGAGEP